MPGDHTPPIKAKLELEIAEQNLLIEELQQTLDSERKKYEKLYSENNDLRNESAYEINEMRIFVKEEKQKSKSYNYEIKMLKNELEQYKSKTKDFDKRQKEIKTNHDEEISNLKEQFTKQILHLKSEEANNKEIYRRQIETFKKELENYTQQINNLDKKLSDSSANNSILKEQLNERDKKCNKLLAKVEILNEKLSSNINTNEELNEKLDSALLEIEEHKKINKQIDKKMRQMKIQHEEIVKNLKDSYETIQNAYHNDMRALDNPLKSLITCLSFLKTDESSDDEKMTSDDMSGYILKKIRKAYSQVEKIRDNYMGLYEDNDHLFKENERFKHDLNKCKELYQEQIEILEKQIDEQKCIVDNKEHEIKIKNNELEQIKTERDYYKSLSDNLNDFMHNENTNKSPNTPSNESFNYNLRKSIEVNKFTQLATSTPFPRVFDVQAGGEAMPFKFEEEKSPMHLSIISWMEQCLELETINKGLTKHIEDLELKIKDTEFNSNIIKEELLCFTTRSIELEKKIQDYTDIKTKLFEISEQKNMQDLNIKALQEQIKCLEDKNNKLVEDNLEFEDKCKSYIEAFKESGTDIPGMTETMLNNFNDKMKQVILLKGENRALSTSKNSLIEQFDKLTQLKNLYCLKLDQISHELSQKKVEYENMFEEKIKLSSKNKVLEKELEMSNLKVNYLASLRDSNWGMDSPSLLEKMQKDLLILCKLAIEQKLQLDTALSERKINAESQQELDARHQFQIMSKMTREFETEKENLHQKIREQQHLLNKYQKTEGCDEGWLLRVEQLENDILSEMKFHREQYARIEEALRSTGKLLDELQTQKDSIRIKNMEVARIEKNLEDTKFKLRTMEMQVQLLQKELNQEKAIHQDIIEEKKGLEHNLKLVQSNLAETELKLTYEIKNNEWKDTHYRLQNAQIEIENNLNKFSEQAEKNRSDNESTFRSSFIKQVENDYKEALEKIKFFYQSEFSSNLSQQQEEHKNQIEKLNEIIKKQSSYIESIVGNGLIDILDNMDDIQKLSFKELLDLMEKIRQDVKKIESDLCDDQIEIFHKFKSYMEENFNSQLILAQKILKEEHDKQYEISFHTLKQLHKEDILLLKLQHEADLCKERLKKISEQKNTQKITFFHVENLLKNDVLDQFNILIQTGYFNSVELFFSEWNPTYMKQIKELKNNIEKELFNKKTDIESTQNYLWTENNLIENTQKFLKSLENFKTNLLTQVELMVNALNQETSQCFQNIKEKHNDVNQILILKDKIKKLEKEKDDLDKQYRSVINLLNSDHEVEVAKTNKLLTELKQLCETGCNTTTLINLRTELEEKHKKEVEELRTYFEKKCADMEKNFSDEIFSQHSRKMSTSSCSDSEISERLYDIGGGGDNRPIDSRVKKITNNEWEDMLMDEMGTSLSNTTINKVKTDMFNVLRANIESGYVNKIKELSSSIDTQLTKVTTLAKTQDDKIIRLQKKINILKNTPKMTPKEIEIIERNAVENFLKDLLEFLPRDKTVLKTSYNLNNIDDIDKIYQDKYSEILSNQNENHTKQIEEIKSDFFKLLDFKTESISGSQESIADIHNIIKERDDLKTMHLTLKNAVSQLTNYLKNSEDELIKAMRSSIETICDDTNNTNKINQKIDIMSNISLIIKELDETKNSFDDLDETFTIRQTLETCMARLKEEAEAVLNLSRLNLEQENEIDKLNKEMNRLKDNNLELLRKINIMKSNDPSDASSKYESGYEYHSQTVNLSANYLQNKVRTMLLDSGKDDIVKILDDISIEGDNLLEKLQKERDDLEQEVIAADKQLKANKRFHDEQTSERECERDELYQKVENLKSQLREKEKECTSNERFNSEVQELSEELRKALSLVEETKKEKDSIESDLKTAVDKIWLLRELISDLETELAAKNEHGSLLEKKLDDLEVEIEHQSGAQSLMVQELESLRNQSLDETCLNQLQELQEKQQFNSSHMRHFKIQLKEMEKIVEDQVKELEALNLANSTNSLSSPSEEVSIRDFLRSKTPELCSSPIGFPVEEVNRLYDKICKHARCDEVLIKKLRDQDIRVAKMTDLIENIQTENDILQTRIQKQMAQIAESNNKVDDLRQKADAANVKANRELIKANERLKQNITELKQLIDIKSNDLSRKENQLKKAEEQISSQNVILQNLSHCNPEILDTLRLELAAVVTEKNKLEGLVNKYKREKEHLEKSNEDNEVLNALLRDKNEDIDHLQQSLEMLQNQQSEDEKSSKSKNLRVSFAADVMNTSVLSEGSKLRDAPHRESFGSPTPLIFNIKDKSLSPIAQSTVLPERIDNTSIHIESPDSISHDESYDTIQKLSLELAEKNDEISKLHKELSSYQMLSKDLENTKLELENAVSSIDSDKEYYEKQFISLTEMIKNKDDKIFEQEKTIIKINADVKALRNLHNQVQNKLKKAEALALNECQKDETFKQLLSEKSLNDNLQKNLSELSSQCEFYVNRIEELSKENEKLLVNSEISENKLKNFITCVKNLKNELSMDSASCFDITDEINSIHDEIKNLNTKLNEITIEKHLVDQELELIKKNNELKNQFDKEAEIDILNIKIIELQNAITSIKKKHQEDINKLNLDINQFQEDVKCVKNSESLALERLNKTEAEKEELSTKLDMIQKKVKNLKFDEFSSQNVSPNNERINSQKIEILETNLLAKMETIKILKTKMDRYEKEIQELKSHKYDLESQHIRLERLNKTQQKQINILNQKLNDEKNNNLTLELGLANKDTKIKQLEELLEEERSKSRNSQKDDIQLIESMRNRLKTLMENQTLMKNLLSEEKQKAENFEAQLNSLKTMERYQSDSENESNIEDKYNKLLIELEKEKLNNEDLKLVLIRERNALSSLKNSLHKIEQEKISLTAQLNSLVNEIKLEKYKRTIIEDRLKTMTETREIVNKEIYEQSIATANSVIKDLEDECQDLKTHIKNQQEQEEKWRGDIYNTLIKQLTEMSTKIKTLIKEREVLESSMSKLKYERKDLEKELDNLKKVTQNPEDPYDLDAPRLQLDVVNNNKHRSILDRNVSKFLNTCMRAESFRKSLAYQKLFLLRYIQGYQNEEKYNLHFLIPGYIPPRKKTTFKTAALVVLCTIKIRRYPQLRKVRRDITFTRIVDALAKENLLRNAVLDYRFNELPSVSHVPHSPPCRDRPENYRPFTSRIRPSPSTSEYLARFDELHRRLDETVQRTNS